MNNKIICGLLVLAVVMVFLYMCKSKPETENFSGAFDPSSRTATGIIGPVLDPANPKCADCNWGYCDYKFFAINRLRNYNES